MKKNTLDQKAELFFAKNWKYLFGTIAFAVLIVVCAVFFINSKMDDLEKIVVENNGKVILLTDDGSAVKIEKTPLKVQFLKQYTISTLVNNLIVSRDDIVKSFAQNASNNNTNGSVQNDFSNITNVLKSSKALLMISEEYLDRQAFRDFKRYLNQLSRAIGKDQLPEKINIKGYSVDSYIYEENHFDVELTVNVIAESYILLKGSSMMKRGNIKILAGGKFDLRLSSGNNPYGMKIDRLAIGMIKKGE